MVCFILFIYSRAINIYWFPTVNLFAVMTLFADVRFTFLLARVLKNTNYFFAIRISISLAILSEIFIQTGYCFFELCQKTKVGVFSEHSVSNEQLRECFAENIVTYAVLFGEFFWLLWNNFMNTRVITKSNDEMFEAFTREMSRPCSKNL